MKLSNLGNGLFCVQSGVFLTRFGHILLLSLSCVKEPEKIIARTLCFTRQSNLRPSYFFNNGAYVLDFCAQMYPLIFFNLDPF